MLFQTALNPPPEIDTMNNTPNATQAYYGWTTPDGITHHAQVSPSGVALIVSYQSRLLRNADAASVHYTTEADAPGIRAKSPCSQKRFDAALDWALSKLAYRSGTTGKPSLYPHPDKPLDGLCRLSHVSYPASGEIKADNLQRA